MACRPTSSRGYRIERHSGHVDAPLVLTHLKRQLPWNLCLHVRQGLVGSDWSVGLIIE